MTVTTLQMASMTGVALRAMNDHINTHGAIKPSSEIIKGWHEYDNLIWKCILTITKTLADQGAISVPNYVDKDIDLLLQHLNEYDIHHHNLLYPTPKETGKLPGALTHANRAKYDKSIKTRTFRFMMNMRESICFAIDIDLPNEDSSRGKLTPSPKETLFEY
jgi:hypothetical protein